MNSIYYNIFVMLAIQERLFLNILQIIGNKIKIENLLYGGSEILIVFSFFMLPNNLRMSFEKSFKYWLTLQK